MLGSAAAGGAAGRMPAFDDADYPAWEQRRYDDILERLDAATQATAMSIAMDDRRQDLACRGLCLGAPGHQWRVTGHATLPRGHAFGHVLGDLRSWITRRDENRFTTFCFSPAHAIRVQTHQGTVDFVVCFACSSMEMVVDDDWNSATKLSLPPQVTASDWDALFARSGVSRISSSAPQSPTGKP